MTAASPLLTQLVGSYSMPGWLTNHHQVTTPTGTFRRPESEVLGEAQDDATRLAIFDQERAGLDIALAGIRATTAVHMCYGYATLGEKHADAIPGLVHSDSGTPSRPPGCNMRTRR